MYILFLTYYKLNVYAYYKLIYLLVVKAPSKTGAASPVKKTSPRKQTPKKNSPKQRKKNDRIKRMQLRQRLAVAQPPSPNASEDSDDSSAPTDARWLRFRRAQLDDEVSKKIVEQVVLREQELADNIFGKEQWICFIDRVAREYLYLHARNYPKDEMHLYRESPMTSAVSVIMTQLRPLVIAPMEGNLKEIVPATQRIVEFALELSGKPKVEKPNSSGWVAAKLKSGDMTFRECDEHPELMDAKVSKTMAKWYKKGSKTGAYMLSPGQTIPGPEALYKLSDRRVGRRRATVGGVVVPAC